MTKECRPCVADEPVFPIRLSKRRDDSRVPGKGRRAVPETGRLELGTAEYLWANISALGEGEKTLSHVIRSRTIYLTAANSTLRALDHKLWVLPTLSWCGAAQYVNKFSHHHCSLLELTPCTAQP